MDLKQKLLNCISDPDIEFGIAVHHIESGEETLINPDALFPTASVFKLPVMVEVFKQASEGKFSLDDRLELTDKDKTLPSGVLFALQQGLKLSIQDLMVLMIIISDNVATTMLLDLVGAENVTASMHALGLSSIWVNLTVHEMFLHAFGIPPNKDMTIEELFAVAQTKQMDYSSLTFSLKKENNVASARDMARLMTLIHQGEIINREACNKMLLIMSLQQYNNRVSRYLPWMTVPNKGGTLRGVRNNTGLINCTPTSHVAFGIFSFDSTPLPLNDPRPGVERDSQVDYILAEMGLVLYQHYGGKFSGSV